MLVAVCAGKGSPGATTAALALVSTWREPAVLVEADPYGGDLAIRLRTKTGAVLPAAPTVLTLATAARTGQSPELVGRYAHRITDQVSVIPGHLAAEQLSGVPDWEPLAEALAASSSPVVVDLGRLHGSSPLLPVASRADVVVVVARPQAGSVIHLRERMIRLVPALATRRDVPPRLFPVLVSLRRQGEGDVADVRRILSETSAGPLIAGAGHLTNDPAAVRRLESGETPTGRLARTALMRSAGALANQLADLCGQTETPTGVVSEAR